ncbi:hypothetical protein Tcan_04669 [Toxocara canis]|nr:hypothetical protein Tcan_04669 [Toxocara canis]
MSNLDSALNSNEQVNFIEFIRSVKNTDELSGEEETSDQVNRKRLNNSRSNSTTRKENHVQSGGKKPANERIKPDEKARSRQDSPEVSPAQERKYSGEGPSVKSSLRLKAMRNWQKSAFHSLDIADDDSAASTSSLHSMSADLLQMPIMEGASFSAKKTDSEPANMGQRHSREAQSHPAKRKQLHVTKQPDGSTIGYVTKE